MACRRGEVQYCRLLMGGCVVIDSPLRLEYLLLLTKMEGCLRQIIMNALHASR